MTGQSPHREASRGTQSLSDARAQEQPLTDRLAIVGSGAIACGLAATAAHQGPVLLLARSQSSARRARLEVEQSLRRAEAIVDPQHVQVVTDLNELSGAAFIIEAVVENHEVKAELLRELDQAAPEEAILASTTSSLSIERLAAESGRPDRFMGLHVFNPVTKMQLVELVFPGAATQRTRTRALALCATLEKIAVEVPDIPGFVVNRLLFPYLFSAVRLLEDSGLTPVALDTCMRLGAGHPLGPLALLDLVGLDVAHAIGEAISEPVPPRLQSLIGEGALGRKSGRGFHSY